MLVTSDYQEEFLLEQLGIPWNGWQYEREAFEEMNLELEENGIPIYQSFSDYLKSRIEYKKRV